MENIYSFYNIYIYTGFITFINAMKKCLCNKYVSDNYPDLILAFPKNALITPIVIFLNHTRFNRVMFANSKVKKIHTKSEAVTNLCHWLIQSHMVTVLYPIRVTSQKSHIKMPFNLKMKEPFISNSVKNHSRLINGVVNSVTDIVTPMS
jgi:hypothetical protein